MGIRLGIRFWPKMYVSLFGGAASFILLSYLRVISHQFFLQFNSPGTFKFFEEFLYMLLGMIFPNIDLFLAVVALYRIEVVIASWLL